MMAVKMPLAGSMHRATRVSFQLMESIIHSTPTRVTTAWMTWVMQALREWDTVSTSLVMRLITSPLEYLWKKLMGSLLILAMMALRRL